MKKVIHILLLGLLGLSAPAFAAGKKPMRPARDVTSNTDLYPIVWHCTFTVTTEQKTLGSCVSGTFTNSRTFKPIQPYKKSHKTIANRLMQFLTGFYGYESYPYTDTKSKKPIPRPNLCQFEMTHGETAEDTAIIHARSGVCPLMTPSGKFLFHEQLTDAANNIAYERGEVPGGLAEDNDD